MAFEALEIKGFPEEIVTADLRLRKLRIEDAADLFELIERNRDHLRRFMPWERGTRSVEDSRSFLEASLRQWEDGQAFDYGIFEKSTGERIGGFGVHQISWQHHRAELGYWIAAAREGHGFASQSLRAIEDLLFQRGFHRLEIRCASANQRSAQVALRQGYVLEGTLREHAIENGEFRDTQVFAKLRSEWRVVV